MVSSMFNEKENQKKYISLSTNAPWTRTDCYHKDLFHCKAGVKTTILFYEKKDVECFNEPVTLTPIK